MEILLLILLTTIFFTSDNETGVIGSGVNMQQKSYDSKVDNNSNNLYQTMNINGSWHIVNENYKNLLESSQDTNNKDNSFIKLPDGTLIDNNL
jgi:hypothetical protein